MKLLYEIHKQSKPDFPNFGDELNLWLWPQYFPELLDGDDSVLFVGIGTVLDNTLPVEARKVIFGAGNGYGPVPVIDDRYRIYCVRGPLTAKKLGLDPQLAITDPAILVRDFVSDASSEAKQGVVLMGHFSSATNSDWSFACQELGMSFVHPYWDRERVLSCIRSAECVVTESMHGAIIADALRVPWVPIITRASACPFKWTDWTSSVGLKYSPIELPALWDQSAPPKSFLSRLRVWAKRRLFVNRLAPAQLEKHAQLSSDSVLETRIAQLHEKIDELKRDASREGWGMLPGSIGDKKRVR